MPEKSANRVIISKNRKGKTNKRRQAFTLTRSRFDSRKYFMKTTSGLRKNPMVSRIEAWKERTKKDMLGGWDVPL